MTNIKNKIDTIIYGYDPKEFLPVFYEGRLDNRNQFLAYKAKKAALRTLYATVDAMSAVYDAAYKN